jgi:hypothetical protein
VWGKKGHGTPKNGDANMSALKGLREQMFVAIFEAMRAVFRGPSTLFLLGEADGKK